MELLHVATEKGPLLALQVGGATFLYLLIRQVGLFIFWWAKFRIERYVTWQDLCPAGGREIHFLPAGLAPRTTVCFTEQPDTLKAVLNPRRFLQSHDLHVLQEMFPLAIGARVLISGFIVILFKSRADVEKSWTQDGFASQFGNPRLKYDVTEDTPTRTEVSRGAAIAPKSDERETNASLGLKIRLLDGQEAITVPTHAFVKVKLFNGPRLLRLADWYARIKTALSRFTPAGKDSHELAVGTIRRGSASKAENGGRSPPTLFPRILEGLSS